jgi:ATP-dependent Lhr-like helicase
VASGRPSVGRSRFRARRSAANTQIQGRWSLAAGIFRGVADGAAGAVERRRALAELLLERYGIVTREQVLAEGIRGGFAILYDTFANLETLGVCRRGYFIEGMGGAQFALPGAVERLRAGGNPPVAPGVVPGARVGDNSSRRSLVLAAADPAQPYGAALAWPKRKSQERSPPRVAGAYVVLVEDQPALYVERGGRGLVTLADAERLHEGLAALAAAVRAGRTPKLALERIDGLPALGSQLAPALAELGFHSGPRRLTLTA